MDGESRSFWNIPADAMLEEIRSSRKGISSDEAKKRLISYGPNLLKPKKKSGVFTLLIGQFKSPIILILFFATGMSFFLQDPVDAFIILTIIVASGLLGFWQEYGATNAVEKLLAIVQIKTRALRDGLPVDVPVEWIVPGDVVVLNAGDLVPGDALILESNDLFVDEAMLTGETFPVEKSAAVLSGDPALAQRTNSLWMGTHVVSGSVNALVVHTGKGTEFGKVSERLKLRPPETEFERGIRRFGYFLLEVTLVLVVAIFAINVFLKKPVLDSFLFSLALAVGLTPQLLPAIISINLAHGAKKMAKVQVIVKKLNAIENFGSMNVICSDKTGTLTEGIVHVQSGLDRDGNPSEKVLFHAYLNSFYETGFTNPIDEAVCAYRKFDLTGYTKQDEIPYDFLRKRLSILVLKDGENVMVTKGALSNILEICENVETENGAVAGMGESTEIIRKRLEELSNKGFRTLGVSYKKIGTVSRIKKEDEKGMTFLGFLVLFDPPKANIIQTIADLKALGIALKVITGDNRLVAANVARQIGLNGEEILTGEDLRSMSDNALIASAADMDVFAEIEPNQKEQIVRALQKSGNVVGYMGDGINDTSALHAADVGISVDSAVDVAKETADFVLMKKDLSVLADGVREGRMTFANTLKYVFMATSANFGNMFSMAGASLFLPFLPLLPKQILLTNLMTDFPEMTIASDRVDKEMVDQPRRWDIKAIRKFMLTFGIISSVFDYMTFGVLLFLLHASQDQFRTGWFVESVVSAALIVLVIRSRRPFFTSKPGSPLLIATLLIAFAAVMLVLSPLGPVFGFGVLPAWAYLYIGGIVVLYILSAEIAKKIFYRMVKL